MSIQKREFLVKVKEREDFNHRRHAVSALGVNTLEYFEDYNLKRNAACPAIAFGDGGRLAKRAVYGWALNNFTFERTNHVGKSH